MYSNTIKILFILMCYLPFANSTFAYTRQDTLRGSNGTARQWWNVKEYYLYATFDTTNKSISGMNIITFTSTDLAIDSMQIDLQEPMILDSAVLAGQQLPIVREKNVYWLKGDFKTLDVMKEHQVTLYYRGKPREAKLPPWDGGFIWTKDSTGKPWISVACQGLGASSWWPCKDYQGDEPDNGMTVNLYIASELTAVSNGRLKSKNYSPDSSAILWVWGVKNPINTYNATFYIGNYESWADTLMGEKGKLDITYYALAHNIEKAKKHFNVVKPMLQCFEYWMGPYPFYEDGYKLVEAPFLGMEHQSAIAYGNEYKMGYRGVDRSGTGVGNMFDFIIIHESGHEWYGNNITAADIADNWIHEGFTTYTETLFAECAFGKEKAYQYARGEWKNIRNDKPVIGDYGVNDDGSSDKYDKGAAVVHMIRTMMSDDEKFRMMLRDMNKQYYHSTVTSSQVENYIASYSGLDLKAFFDQYLRTTTIPELEWYINKEERRLYYRFTNTIDGFTLPLTVKGRKREERINVSNEWNSVNWKKGGYNVNFSKDYLIKAKL